MFCALAAWIVDPANENLRKLAISRQVARQMIALENELQTKYTPAFGNLARHLLQWAEPEVAKFYDQVYFPIGGLDTIISTYPSSRFQEEMSRASGGVNTAIKVVAIYHLHMANLADAETFYAASLRRAASILSTTPEQKPVRGEGGTNADNIKKQWRRCRSSISLAYAASLTSVKSDGYSDLLDVMQSGKVSWEKHGGLLQKLLNRACFVEEQILSRCYANESVPLSLATLPEVSAQPFKPRAVSDAEKLHISKAFARRPGVEQIP